MEETISLGEIVEPIKKRLSLIILIAVIITAITGFISLFVLTPVYQADTQILVQSDSNQNQMNYTQLQTNLGLINTYNVIIKSPRILDQVVTRLHLNESTGGLRKQLTVSSQQNSQVVDISVQNPSPKKAVKIANTIAEVFQKQIGNIMSVHNVSILSKATLGPNPQPVKPSAKKNIAIAIVLGLLIGVGLAYLLEFLDKTIKNEKEVENLLGLPVLGVISEIDGNEQSKRKKQVKRNRIRGELS